MKISTGNVKISIWMNDFIGFDEDYFIPRFEKAIKGNIDKDSSLGTAFDDVIILEYESLDNLINYIMGDLKAIQKICNRNIKRLLPRTEKNEHVITLELTKIQKDNYHEALCF